MAGYTAYTAAFTAILLMCVVTIECESGHTNEVFFEEFEKLRQRIEVLETQVISLRNENKNLQHGNNILKDNIVQLTQQVSELNSITEEILTGSKILPDGNSYIKFQQNSIGFSAYHGGGTTYGDGQTAIYPNVITNDGPEGSNYDPATGIFHCGTPGLYYFAFHFMNIPDTDAYFSLMVGGASVGTAHGTSVGGGQSGSNAALVHCANEDVRIMSRGTSTLSGGDYSSFSGYLVSLD